VAVLAVAVAVEEVAAAEEEVEAVDNLDFNELSNTGDLQSFVAFLKGYLIRQLYWWRLLQSNISLQQKRKN
jgi:hypothetical protein